MTSGKIKILGEDNISLDGNSRDNNEAVWLTATTAEDAHIKTETCRRPFWSNNYF